MADQHGSIDLRTLEEVHRLLARTEVGGSDDRHDPRGPSAADRAAVDRLTTPVDAAALPRRR